MDHAMKASDRRQFLKNAAYATLAVTVLGRVSSASDELTDEEADASSAESEGDVLKIVSGRSAYFPLPGHLHTLSIPLEAIKNPPSGGIRPQTTWAFLHHHIVPLTCDQLCQIAQGETVTVADTVKDHLYEIKLAEFSE